MLYLLIYNILSRIFNIYFINSYKTIIQINYETILRQQKKKKIKNKETIQNKIFIKKIHQNLKKENKNGMKLISILYIKKQIGKK